MITYTNQNKKLPKIEWEGNTALRHQKIKIKKWRDAVDNNGVNLSAGPHGRLEDRKGGYVVTVYPYWTGTYPGRLSADLVFDGKKRPSGMTAPSRIIVWGLRGGIKYTYTRADKR